MLEIILGSAGTVVGVIALVQSNGSSGNETQKIPQPKRAVSAPKTELKREPALIPSIMQITSDSKELVKCYNPKSPGSRTEIVRIG
ncbi:hypothetical protein WN944_017249 [Citrus x changshan-huyou]|uniref:Uncharacterized protein n=1 Tax=Citrus x changshan-huyou TaxID=2935761 RepID=A0AAP0QPC4_9ROSI